MKYRPIGDEVGMETALLQAANALDVAGKIAQANKDSQTLISVADQWVRISDFIATYSAHQEEQEAKRPHPGRVPVGFQGVPRDIQPETIIAEEEENAGSREDDPEPDCLD